MSTWPSERARSSAVSPLCDSGGRNACPFVSRESHHCQAHWHALVELHACLGRHDGGRGRRRVRGLRMLRCAVGPSHPAVQKTAYAPKITTLHRATLWPRFSHHYAFSHYSLPTFVDVHTSVSKKEAHDGFVTVLGRHKERSGASLQHGSESQTTCRRSAFDGGGIVSQNAVRKTCISATLTDLALFTSTRESARRRLTTEVIPF